ncbi:MAG: NAD-dependent malic enzyme [Pseudomonadota bacterium]
MSAKPTDSLSPATDGSGAAAPSTLAGLSVLHDPLRNKGTAFTHKEREALGLNGLLPAAYNTQDQQAERTWATLSQIEKPLDRYRELTSLQDRNEYLYYRVLMDHLQELMPIVYTPTVGAATQHFSRVFQRGRGVWITPDHIGRVQEILANATARRDIRLLVVTDNESILGIGDQGAGGMAISIGKLSLYTAAAGIAPEQTLPISLDVGTDNQALLDDPNYLGWQKPRLRGPLYESLVEEFVSAVKALFPKALLQWEDFRKSNALTLMERYRPQLLSFNDDIQGTGAVTLAGVMSALRVKQERLSAQRIVIHGAGAAGLGIAQQIKAALAAEGIERHLMHEHLALLDSRGLLVDDQDYADGYKRTLAWPAAFAKAQGLGESADRDLDAVVARYQPTVLIGTSGTPGVFDEPIARAMLAATPRPVILPLSNPTANAEATPEALLQWTDGAAIIATGSPFQPVTLNGREHKIGQGNNVFIFPGLGLGSLHVEASAISDGMITAAAQALADAMTEAELASGLLYPDVSRLRAVTARVATAVAAAAVKEGLSHMPAPGLEAIEQSMWRPVYPQHV